MCAFAWVNVVTQPGMIFGFVRNMNINPVLAKPLFSCESCVAGQWSLWLGAFYFRTDVIQTVFMVLLSIFFAWLINQLRAHI